MSLITLIRHGESVWNGERRIQGNQDPPLSPRGRRQAELLAARMHAHLPKAAAINRVNDTCHLTGAGTDLVPKDVLTDAGDPADIAP